MREYKLVATTMERIIYKYNEIERIKKNYGTNIDITQSEIHIIESIGDFSKVNITKLAKIKRKTKGAISQMINKLVDKELVNKNISKHSDAEVVLSLTNLGKIAYEGHREFHKNSNEKIFKKLRDMSDESYSDLIELLTDFEEFLDKRIEEN